MLEVEPVVKDLLKRAVPDWPYYRTQSTQKTQSDAGGASIEAPESGRRRSRNK